MDHDQDEGVAAPAFPAATIATTLLVFLFFAFLVVFVQNYANRLDVAGPAVLSGEQKLAELRGDEEKITTTFGYDKATGAVRVPVVVAVKRLAEEAAANGKLPFPMKPTAPKAEPAKTEVKKEEAKKEEPKKHEKK